MLLFFFLIAEIFDIDEFFLCYKKNLSTKQGEHEGVRMQVLNIF